MIQIEPIEDRAGIAWANQMILAHHYLHQRVNNRCAAVAYAVKLAGFGRVGLFIVGRPEATKTKGFWAALPLHRARARAYPYTNWEIANLARVWFDPAVQPGGALYRADVLPGFQDRRGEFRSTLASAAIRALAQTVGVSYLLAKPPITLDVPWRLRWLISYCDTSRHKGTIYKAAGFELYRTNGEGIQLWRLPLPPWTIQEDRLIAQASQSSRRARRKRAALAGNQPQQPSLLMEV